jgi:hypothetical protein
MFFSRLKGINRTTRHYNFLVSLYRPLAQAMLALSFSHAKRAENNQENRRKRCGVGMRQASPQASHLPSSSNKNINILTIA